MIEPKPYKLINEIQHYDWGTKNKNAFIPKLLGIEPEKDLPYAELWIGAHPKASSKIELNGKIIKLDELIKEYPAEILGEKVIRKFGKSLPFLLKILSCEKALSIQAHPNKNLAKILHSKDPQNYPDDNHKPEVAIAINYLKSIVGFKPLKEFIEVIERYPAMKELIDTNSIDGKNFIKNYYTKIMQLPNIELEDLIQKLHEQIFKSKDRTNEEIIFLKEFENYGYDVGLISILLFNYIELERGEAIYTGAGIPHAYIEGNIVECMANSDNVVRAGLTAKFKDVDTLLNMLEFTGNFPAIINPNTVEKDYKTEAEEFAVKIFSCNQENEFQFENDKVKIGLILNGEISFGCNDSKVSFNKGESFIVPAILNQFTMKCKGFSEIIIVEIP